MTSWAVQVQYYKGEKLLRLAFIACGASGTYSTCVPHSIWKEGKRGSLLGAVGGIVGVIWSNSPTENVYLKSKIEGPKNGE